MREIPCGANYITVNPTDPAAGVILLQHISGDTGNPAPVEGHLRAATSADDPGALVVGLTQK
ncbi:MAG: hypothetical protein JSV86_18420 [Gemmatimonadota bacterium]|nr:MAG: hypothetical protein JSV86_18420 [Gemmatimonadota bacterium]